MQPLASGAALTAYHNRLRSSHDFKIHVDILDLNEVMVGSAVFLDGQVNFVAGQSVRRTATLTLSDPAGALDFSDASTWSGTSLWADRLVRVRHVVTVPNYGEFTAVPFIGPPARLSRQGAEVQVECQDKSALAIRGARNYTAAKGTSAVGAIRAIMTACTGEFRYRLPSSSRRLSKAYSVGHADEAAPFLVAGKIASAELGMQLIYSCDGYLTLRPVPTSSIVDLGHVTDQASVSADFTTIVNFVRVVGGSVSRKVGTKTVNTTSSSIAEATPSNRVSSTRLARKGVLRLLPLEISEDKYTTVAQTARRAASELAAKAGVHADISASVVPMFHLDVDDIVTVRTDDNTSRTLRLSDASIPLGVGGDMSIGFTRWVSQRALGRVRSKHTRRVIKPKPKHKPRRRHRRHR